MPNFQSWPAFCKVAARAREGVEAQEIMDGKLALLYFIIIAMITLSYLNDEKVDRMKHVITAAVGIHAATK